MKLRHLTGLALLSALVAMIGISYLSARVVRFPGDRGSVYDSWGAANGTFQVRITAYNEVGIFMPGAFFSFETAPVDSDDWREFKDFRTDDPVPVRMFSERFRFVNASTAYVSTGDEFLLTQDSGRTWSAWRPTFLASNGERIGWNIREVRVESDGTGKAGLSRFDDQGKEMHFDSFTGDYGQIWSSPSPRK